MNSRSKMVWVEKKKERKEDSGVRLRKFIVLVLNLEAKVTRVKLLLLLMFSMFVGRGRF